MIAIKDITDLSMHLSDSDGRRGESFFRNSRSTPCKERRTLYEDQYPCRLSSYEVEMIQIDERNVTISC